MGPQAAKEYKTEKAEELAELYAIQQDLGSVIEWLKLMLDCMHPDAKDEDSKKVYGWWMACLVFYGRCFNTSVRKALDSGIYKNVPGEPQKLHQWLLDMRDKRTAHSVNAYEQYGTGLIIIEKNGALRVDGTTVGHLGYVFPGLDDCKMILDFVTIAHENVNKRVVRLTGEVIQEGRQLSQDKLKSARTLRFTAPGPEQAGKRR